MGLFFSILVSGGIIYQRTTKRRADMLCKRYINYPSACLEVLESVSIYKLESIVSSFYSEVKQSKSSVLVYKGGHYERDLLGNLDIPIINLENYGCPKVEITWTVTMDGNMRKPSDAYLHCPKVEVEAME